VDHSGTSTTPEAANAENLRARLEQANAKAAAAELRLAEMENKIKELEELALTDPVTGLMNRRGFEKFFAQEHARMRRHDVPGSVLLMFELDKFKEINDTHGHLAGDACLKKVGEYLRGRLRTLDGAARIGGDEFAVLLSHTDPEKAAARISEMKAALGDMLAVWQEKELHFSASVGLEYLTAEGTYESACQAADQSLYSNKRAKKA
jgi:diguanylate cyclase (GGDEF)-like protein